MNENMKNSNDGGKQKFGKVPRLNCLLFDYCSAVQVEENFNALQAALREIQTDNGRKIERVVEESRNSKELLAWMEGKIKDSKVSQEKYHITSL